ncbi:uncharacterized protein ACBT44_003406 [Syngnathus typhle]
MVGAPDVVSPGYGTPQVSDHIPMGPQGPNQVCQWLVCRVLQSRATVPSTSSWCLAPLGDRLLADSWMGLYPSWDPSGSGLCVLQLTIRVSFGEYRHGAEGSEPRKGVRVSGVYYGPPGSGPVESLELTNHRHFTHN